VGFEFGFPKSTSPVHLGVAGRVTLRADGSGVLILAHRGLPGIDCPENSVAAVAAAFDCGADGVEVDLRLTADGVLAVSHDEDLYRLTGVPQAIAHSSWATLLETAEQRGVQLARAEQVLGQAAGRLVVLEVKEPPPGRTSGYGTAVAVVDLLKGMRHAGVALDVTVSSFEPNIIAAVRGLLPGVSGVRTALLGRPEDGATALLRQAVTGGHDELHPHVSSALTEPGVVAAGRANGVVVVPWTVNARRAVQRLETLGAHGLITDVPETARTTLSRVTV
jgi:glycerophosphoryl diester phosphodiesterase